LMENIGRVKTIYSTYPDTNRYLLQSGFGYLCHGCVLGPQFPEDHMIKLQRFTGESDTLETEVVGWIKDKVLHFLPALSQRLSRDIVDNLWEIIQNGLFHSRSPGGVSACGQFYPAKGYFELAFCDLGLGIPRVVREAGILSTGLSDQKYIEWALMEGTSTQPGETAAGMGLFLLRDFLKLNGGSLEIASLRGYYGQGAELTTESTSLKNQIRGTLVNLRVIFDSKIYKYSSEGSHEHKNF
jgi:hypothetical protein